MVFSERLNEDNKLIICEVIRFTICNEIGEREEKQIRCKIIIQSDMLQRSNS